MTACDVCSFSLLDIEVLGGLVVFVAGAGVTVWRNQDIVCTT